MRTRDEQQEIDRDLMQEIHMPRLYSVAMSVMCFGSAYFQTANHFQKDSVLLAADENLESVRTDLWMAGQILQLVDQEHRNEAMVRLVLLLEALFVPTQVPQMQVVSASLHAHYHLR